MAKGTDKITDTYNRPLRDLRISVTDRCNFRCRYCMPEEIFGADYSFLPKAELLSFNELIRLITIFTRLGTEKIRITGGEPLLRKDLPSLIDNIRRIEGIRDIALTTNGSFLGRMAADLAQAGLQRVTVSLDSLNDEKFGRMNGVGWKVQSVLDGITAAKQAGLSVKINMVVQKGVNDQDILPMARFFKQAGLTLRFIEYMDVGNTNGWKLEQVVPSKHVVELINAEMPLEPVEANYYGEVASRYRYVGTATEIGLISSVTQAFCSTCTRARLSADGQLYTCLFASKGYDLRTPLREGADDLELEQQIQAIWHSRSDRYSAIRLSHTPELQLPKVEMSRIGG